MKVQRAAGALAALGLALVGAGFMTLAAGPALSSPLGQMEPFSDQACLNCHTDEERLQTLAVAEEKSESLSSGPG